MVFSIIGALDNVKFPTLEMTDAHKVILAMFGIMRRMQQHCYADYGLPYASLLFFKLLGIIHPQSNHDDGYEYQRGATTLLCRLRLCPMPAFSFS